MTSAGETADPRETHALLRRLQLFSGLDDESLERLVPLARPCLFTRGSLLFTEGSICPGVFAVRTGSVRIFRSSAGGKTHLLHLALPGETVAEVAVVGGFPCPASAEAAEDTTCLLLPRESFVAAIEADGRFALAVMKGLARRVLYMVRLLEDVVLRDAVGRLASHLLSYAEEDSEVHLVMLKKDLASHLNLTSETLSRSLRRLVDEKLIEIVGTQGVRLLDRAALGHLAAGDVPERG